MKKLLVIGTIFAILIIVIAPISPVLGIQNINKAKQITTEKLSVTISINDPLSDDPWYWEAICKIYKNRKGIDLPAWKDPITMNEEDIDGPEEDSNSKQAGFDGFLWTGLDDESDWNYIDMWFMYFRDMDGHESWGNFNLFNFFMICFIVSIIFTPILLGFIALGWSSACLLILGSVCAAEAFDIVDYPTTIYENGQYINYKDGK